ncbi:tetratricopeptide repeat-containing sensor histidine kinase [Kordia sp.]|uniref:tetratricopeptide repeat-containing sensor histidine kinase n=1 Tax=Kordia sp. TaxID=1965332 RepID=UPI003D6A2D4E
MKKRKAWISRAEIEFSKVKNDSLRNNCIYKLENFYLNFSDSLKFRFYNNKGLILSLRLSDSIKIANYNWDKGVFYYRYDLKDSAYACYHYAKEIHNSIYPNDIEVGKLLLNLSRIQKNVKNYIGAEINAIKAIEIFKLFKDKRRLYSGYNQLGIIYKNLKLYDKALKNYYTALNYLNEKDNIRITYSLNNIGLIHRYQGNYQKAINNFRNALETDSLFYKNPRHYSILLDNLAYTKFLSNDTIGIQKLFYKSLHIKDSINFSSGIGISKLHLAEYYLGIYNDSLRSFKLAIEAKDLLKKIKSYKLLLESYDLLAKINSKNSSKYLRRYITISDSLLLEERRTLDKFTRIEYETNELEEQFNKTQMEVQKLGNEATKYKLRNRRVYQILWWIGGSIVIISIVLIVRYYQRVLRNKYEKVVLQQQLLRSQMNPHFLFNTLNTILHANDTQPEKTKQYVLKLSQLLRTTLENSREEFVPLQDEIEAIDNYLNLQSNFSEKFDFKVTIDDALETEFTYVPPMLIQPFVENAIIHGIMNTKTRGLISLDFSLKSKELVSCTITDNGIGYSKNSHEEKSNLKTHKSISGDIVKERLVIYNKQNKTNASLKIEDIADINRNTTGTKVILNLPSYEI